MANPCYPITSMSYDHKFLGLQMEVDALASQEPEKWKHHAKRLRFLRLQLNTLWEEEFKTPFPTKEWQCP